MTEPSIPLHEHLESRIKAVEKQIDISNHILEKRLEAMNEFRQALKDQADRSPTRVEVEIKFLAIERELKSLNTFKDTQQGKADVKDVYLARNIAYFGAALGLVTLILRILGL